MVLADSGLFRFFLNLSGVLVMRNEVEKGRVLRLGLRFGEEDEEIWGIDSSKGFDDFRVLEKKRRQAMFLLNPEGPNNKRVKDDIKLR